MKNDFTNEDKLVLRFQSHIETDKQGHPVAHIEGGKITLLAYKQYKAEAELSHDNYKEEVFEDLYSAMKFVDKYCNKED